MGYVFLRYVYCDKTGSGEAGRAHLADPNANTNPDTSQGWGEDGTHAVISNYCFICLGKVCVTDRTYELNVFYTDAKSHMLANRGIDSLKDCLFFLLMYNLES